MGVVAKNNGQALELELPASLSNVNADLSRIKQVVDNLVTNALKFTPKGGRIIIGARESEGNLIIEVKDDGRGLAKEDLERIFNPYYRKESDRNQLSGLGLGLSLCKKFIDLHGGRIWAESEPGEGSTFSFSLPIISQK